MRNSIALALSVGVVVGAVLAPAAASAATAQPGATSRSVAVSDTAPGDPDTTVTFAVSSGLLTMTAPASAFLGSGSPGTVISGALGTVAVTDNRALLAASWTATASSTSFTTGGGTGPEIIPATDVTYTPGAIAKTGTITTAGSTITVSAAPQTVVTGTAGNGNNTASWNPTIAVAVPAAAITGTYTGVLTQSVT
jgi:hypothetical protein